MRAKVFQSLSNLFQFLTGGAIQFSVCAHCGHPDIDWARKAAIDAHNAKEKEWYKAEVAKYNQVVKTMKKGEKSLKRLVYNQKPLFILCNCAKKFFSWFNGTCPNNCKDGSCDRCTCSCMFVCSTTNYNAVSIAVMAKNKGITMGIRRVDFPLRALERLAVNRVLPLKS